MVLAILEDGLYVHAPGRVEPRLILVELALKLRASLIRLELLILPLMVIVLWSLPEAFRLDYLMSHNHFLGTFWVAFQWAYVWLGRMQFGEHAWAYARTRTVAR